jgi:hypothetical protein
VSRKPLVATFTHDNNDGIFSEVSRISIALAVLPPLALYSQIAVPLMFLRLFKTTQKKF